MPTRRVYAKNFAMPLQRTGIMLHEGVYAGCIGPQYETPAEVENAAKARRRRRWHVDRSRSDPGRALGLEVAGFSCLTNLAAGLSKEKLSHEEVFETANKAAADFKRLVQAALP